MSFIIGHDFPTDVAPRIIVWVHTLTKSITTFGLLWRVDHRSLKLLSSYRVAFVIRPTKPRLPRSYYCIQPQNPANPSNVYSRRTCSPEGPSPGRYRKGEGHSRGTGASGGGREKASGRGRAKASGRGRAKASGRGRAKASRGGGKEEM